MNAIQPAPVPFDTAHLDRLMEAAGLDALVVTSKHNVQYLLGGYRFFFFSAMDALGESRYLPVLVYPRQRPDRAAYVGHRLEIFEHQLGKFWPAASTTESWTSAGAMRTAVEHLRTLGPGMRRIGVEPSFLPLDAYRVLRDGVAAEIVDGHFPLERLRAVKTEAELRLLSHASEAVVAAMQSTFAQCTPGMTKLQVVERLRQEEIGRGLEFEYCLVTAGGSLNRSPSPQPLEAGDIVSLDSGANHHGYIGDLCRMGILGEPDAELQDLLAVVEEVQQAARRPIRPGAHGREIYAAAMDVIAHSPHAKELDFLAHGMGLVSHEAPQLSSTGFVPYAGYDEDRGLEAGMVVSIETALLHKRRGFIKLEDTLAITNDGWVGFGDGGRGWNRSLDS